MSLFSCYDRRLGRCPPPPFFLFYFLLSFFLSLILFSSWREKGARRGTQRRFEHRHSVYIYQNFFAFDRAIAIKMCSCNRRGLSCLFFHVYSASSWVFYSEYIHISVCVKLILHNSSVFCFFSNQLGFESFDVIEDKKKSVVNVPEMLIFVCLLNTLMPVRLREMYFDTLTVWNI